MTRNKNAWSFYKKDFKRQALEKKYSELEIDACLKYADNLYKQGLPIIFDGKHLAELIGFNSQVVYAASNAKELFYKEYIIPKKDGKPRVINEPLPSLKEIQRWILENILESVPVHPCAKAYIKGLSIIDNARFHKGQKSVLKMDILNFFPSINAKYVYALFKRLGYSPGVSKLLTELITYKNGLPQGAPTSPAASNIIMFKADRRIFGYAKSKGLRYTRYADDITLSGDINSGESISFIEKVIKETGFKTNRKKTRVINQSSQQIVTGVVVNQKLQAPKNYRKKIRQELYYRKKYGLDSHLSKRNITKANYIPHLVGMAHHVLNINPSDRDALETIKFLMPNSIRRETKPVHRLVEIQNPK